MKSLERDPYKDLNNPISPTCLFPLKKDVEAVNRASLEKVVGETRLFYSMDDTKGNPDAVKRLNDSLPVPQVLELKINCSVMVCRNVPSIGVYNGQKGRVCKFENDTIHVKFGENIVHVPRESFTVETPSYTLERRQFPLVVSYALRLALPLTLVFTKARGNLLSMFVSISKISLKLDRYMWPSLVVLP
jgi:hypothetical protein